MEEYKKDQKIEKSEEKHYDFTEHTNNETDERFRYFPNGRVEKIED